jgi:hypothetical protein
MPIKLTDVYQPSSVSRESGYMMLSCSLFNSHMGFLATSYVLGDGLGAAMWCQCTAACLTRAGPWKFQQEICLYTLELYSSLSENFNTK